MTGQAQAFFRCRGKIRTPEGEYRDKPWHQQETSYVEFACPDDKVKDLSWLLEQARAAGAPKGTFQTGIFEVQTDAGIWSRPDQMRMSVGDGKSRLRTWEEMEAEDEAAGLVYGPDFLSDCA